MVENEENEVLTRFNETIKHIREKARQKKNLKKKKRMVKPST